jgi:hypothetical protein
LFIRAGTAQFLPLFRQTALKRQEELISLAKKHT